MNDDDRKILAWGQNRLDRALCSRPGGDEMRAPILRGLALIRAGYSRDELPIDKERAELVEGACLWLDERIACGWSMLDDVARNALRFDLLDRLTSDE